MGFKAARNWGRAPHGKIVPSHRNRRHRTRVCASSGEGLETRQGPQRIQPNTHAAAAATRSVRPHNGCQGISTELFHHSTGHAPPSPPNPPPSREPSEERLKDPSHTARRTWLPPPPSPGRPAHILPPTPTACGEGSYGSESAQGQPQAPFGGQNYQIVGPFAFGAPRRFPRVLFAPGPTFCTGKAPPSGNPPLHGCPPQGQRAWDATRGGGDQDLVKSTCLWFLKSKFQKLTKGPPAWMQAATPARVV